MSNTNEPIGIALIAGAGKGWLGVNHVKVTKESLLTKKPEDVEWKYSASLSGAWKVSKNDSETLANLCANHIVINNKAIPPDLALGIQFAELHLLVRSIDEISGDLVAAWESYLASDPKKKNLKRPSSPTLPILKGSNYDAEKILSLLGKAGITNETPEDMRELISLSRVVLYLLECWIETEAQRTSRKYLGPNPKNPRQFPSDWLQSGALPEQGQLELL